MPPPSTSTLPRYSPWTISAAPTAHQRRLGLPARCAALPPTNAGRLVGSGRAAARKAQEEHKSSSLCPAAWPGAPACERAARRGSPRPIFGAGAGCHGPRPRSRRYSRPPTPRSGLSMTCRATLAPPKRACFAGVLRGARRRRRPASAGTTMRAVLPHAGRAHLRRWSRLRSRSCLTGSERPLEGMAAGGRRWVSLRVVERRS